MRSPSEPSERLSPASHDDVRDDERATRPTVDEVAAPDDVELRRGYAAPHDDRGPRKSSGGRQAPRTFERRSNPATSYAGRPISPPISSSLDDVPPCRGPRGQIAIDLSEPLIADPEAVPAASAAQAPVAFCWNRDSRQELGWDRWHGCLLLSSERRGPHPPGLSLPRPRRDRPCAHR